MLSFNPHDTIAALATPAGEGGVAVVRISGPLAPSILEKMFRPSRLREGEGFPPLSSWESHRLYHGRFFNSKNQLLDEGLVVWMKAPRSFTGEEVVEFHLHGGRLIALRMLQALYDHGLRAAFPGEFTQRAFLNGKMDLTQAEAIADMIAAQSDRSLELAQAQWQGQFSGPVSKLRALLLEQLVHVEAAVDFPEEDIEIIDKKSMIPLLDKTIHQVEEWLRDYEWGRMIREGIAVVFLGKPNAGKSSLLNLLSREEAAIVHPQPGTTRDAIERVIHLNGLTLRLVDTAGIRSAEGEVEQIGIDRSRQWFQKADLVLALFDTSQPWESDDVEIVKIASNKKTLWILNKDDLPSQWGDETLFSNMKIREAIPAVVRISAKTGAGLPELEDKIFSLFGIREAQKGDHLLLNQVRHKNALEKSNASLKHARWALEEGVSPELVALDLHAAAHYLGEIIGEVTTEHILEDIFTKFCIGK